MIWFTWRQHRAAAAAAAALILTLAAVLVAIAVPMHEAFAQYGISSCATPSRVAAICRPAMDRFDSDFGYTNQLLIWFDIIPVAVGAFLGVPVLATELESGTWQLAWTQSVPRTRWLAVKLSALVLLVLLLMAALSGIVAWYRQPWSVLQGSFEPTAFDLQGLMPPVYALFALALGVAAGMVLKSGIPALALTLGLAAAVRFAVEIGLRPRYQTAMITVFDPITGEGGAGRGAWGLADGIVDAQGQLLPDSQASAIYQKAIAAGQDLNTYIHEHGLKAWTSYQPADRYWPFQLAEAGIYVALAAVLLTAVLWRLKRRAI